ncbi:hypothetical protein MRB53_038020 [Persea americana]|nr:hypothetical protein MRB53_038020 [Persea americana]
MRRLTRSLLASIHLHHPRNIERVHSRERIGGDEDHATIREIVASFQHRRIHEGRERGGCSRCPEQRASYLLFSSFCQTVSQQSLLAPIVKHRPGCAQTATDLAVRKPEDKLNLVTRDDPVLDLGRNPSLLHVRLPCPRPDIVELRHAGCAGSLRGRRGRHRRRQRHTLALAGVVRRLSLSGVVHTPHNDRRALIAGARVPGDQRAEGCN